MQEGWKVGDTEPLYCTFDLAQATVAGSADGIPHLSGFMVMVGARNLDRVLAQCTATAIGRDPARAPLGQLRVLKPAHIQSPPPGH